MGLDGQKIVNNITTCMGIISGIGIFITVIMGCDRLYEHKLTYIGELTFTLNGIKVNDDKSEYPTKEYGIIQVENTPNKDTIIYAYTRKGLTFEETIFGLNKNQIRKRDLGYVGFSEND